MILTKEEREVLDLVVEDDFGLWEVKWRLDQVMNWSADESAARTAAVVDGLVRKHLAEVFIQRWVDDEPIPHRRSGLLLDLTDEESWAEPEPGRPAWLLAATDLGREKLASAST